MRLAIDTHRRSDGKWNNSPKTTMNPIVRLQIGKTHVIRIPMADSDGDLVRCRWGNTLEECGSVCTPKGVLQSDPCELTYDATQLGYEAVALVIEDFDSDNNVRSSIPLQFLIQIVTGTSNATNSSICTQPPVYIGPWAQGACIGVESNTTMTEHVQVRIPCVNTSTTLANILTVSPLGMIKGPVTQDPSDPNLYTMQIQWIPQADQYGLQQLCMTPADSEQQTGEQVCVTFQVDVRAPEFVLGSMVPTGIVAQSQPVWSISTNRDITPPKRSGVNIRFFKQSNDEEVFRVDVSTDVTVTYQLRQITFYTTGYTWTQGESYYILFDGGVATINESCGVESAPVTNHHFWTFQVATNPTTEETNITTTAPTTATARPTTTPIMSPSTTTIIHPSTSCPRRLSFGTISNETTSASQPSYVFCFTINSSMADVTISANTWVSCSAWKASGAADPLLELYSESNGHLLAQNDDGDSLPFKNCFAAVLSYRLAKGNYRVVIRNSKCAYGKFELRLSTDNTTHRTSTAQQPSLPSCPRLLSFGTVLNITTNVNESMYTFCFTVNTTWADVTVSSNTWIPCTSWKLSGAVDPLLELYSEPNGRLLAQNDDGSHLALKNCYGAVLSYRLRKGDYRVIVRNPKCGYGTFELRLSAETKNGEK
ncbi:unnamed protein product [Rotaria sordida]|uniref:Uncharacterized protein n=1 Tax=Rotaria sordida TaxID=392033 RepID=A0A815R014_9BILA|nr:unnamed protein product [Rotaria sordida]